MIKVHKIAFIALIFFVLCLSIGEKPVFAYQNVNVVSIPLKELLLTEDEVRDSWGISSDMSLYQIDVTSELADLCFVDCVKMVWVSSDNAVYSKLTLIMIRSRRSENATKSVRSLWHIYKSMGSRFYSYDEFTENDDFWLGMMLYPRKTPDTSGKQQYLAVRTQGQVSIIVYYDFIIRSFIADVDSAAYLELVDELSRVQQQKLLEAGFKP